MKTRSGWNWLSLLVMLSIGLAASAEQPGEWIILFDGETLDGWEKHGGGAPYKVEDGTIVGQSVPNSPNTFLCTDRTFADFELIFEVKVDDALNSGVQLRSGIKDNDRVFGPQVEIEASPGAAGYIYGEATGRGWLSRDRPIKDVFRNGEWNHYRVLAQGNRIQTWVNGEPVADLTDDEMRTTGFIGLQVHGVGGREDPLYVAWRNIQIRELEQP